MMFITDNLLVPHPPTNQTTQSYIVYIIMDSYDVLLSANKNATGQLEAQHWKDMLSKPKQSVEYWHRLKPE